MLGNREWQWSITIGCQCLTTVCRNACNCYHYWQWHVIAQADNDERQLVMIISK